MQKKNIASVIKKGVAIVLGGTDTYFMTMLITKNILKIASFKKKILFFANINCEYLNLALDKMK